MSEAEWISVHDRLPEEEAKVLICDGWENIDIAYRGWDDCWYGWTTNYIVIGDVTHWAELPELPQEE